MHELLERMAEDLTLLPGAHELDRDYACRLLWSALGRMMAASLFDREWETAGDMREGETSVVHFKRRAAHLIEAYDAIVPQAGFIDALCAEHREDVSRPSLLEIAETLYQLTLANGVAYHRGFHLRPSVCIRRSLGNVIFVRGTAPGEHVRMSGFGAYEKMSARPSTPMMEDAATSVCSMFQLDAPLDVSVPDRLAAHGTFRPAPATGRAEYLRTDGAVAKGYWQEQGTPGLTLGRVQLPYGPMVYFLCRIPAHGREERMELPDLYDPHWLQQIFLLRKGTLPSAHFHADGALVHLSCGYLYPRREQQFLSFFSWPAPGARGFRAKVERVLPKDFFEGFQALFSSLGFSFWEGDAP